MTIVSGFYGDSGNVNHNLSIISRVTMIFSFSYNRNVLFVDLPERIPIILKALHSQSIKQILVE